MTIEQKAQRYDEAKYVMEYGVQPVLNKKDLQSIFPELKESKNERIRKAIGYAIGQSTHSDGTLINGVSSEEVLAWLEKQDEKGTDPRYKYLEELLAADNIYQMAVNDDMVQEAKTKVINALSELEIGKLLGLEKQREQKLADKAEPKFHEGDWITNGDYTWKIVEVKPLDYILQSQDGNIVDDTISHVDEQFHSFTIQDAKDGDVLFSPSHNLLWLHKDEEQCHVCINLNYNDSLSIETDFVTPSDVSPATKEQRDALEKAMTDAGYTFDFEKKELKKVIDEKQIKKNLQDNSFRRMFEQKPADVRTTGYWHVEDIEQNSVWSEVDKDFMYDTLSNLTELKDRYGEGYGNVGKCIDWLKSLKHQKQWKPIEAQIKTCKEVYADILSAKGFDIGTINSELNRLEKN